MDSKAITRSEVRGVYREPKESLVTTVSMNISLLLRCLELLSDDYRAAQEIKPSKGGIKILGNPGRSRPA